MRCAGRYVAVARLDPAADIAELYDASHRTEEFRALWRYLPKEAFSSQERCWSGCSPSKTAPTRCFTP